MIRAIATTPEGAGRAQIFGGLVTICLLAAPSAAKAGDVDLKFTTPTNTANQTVHVYIGITDISVTIKPGLSAEEKRDAVLAAIKANAVPKFTVDENGKTGLTIKDLTKGTKVQFYPVRTGEKVDNATAFLAPSGDIEFANAKFSTLSYSGAAATFTGGVITSVGALTDTITASTKYPYISGATIVNDLYKYFAKYESTYDFSVAKSGRFDLDFTFSHPTAGFTGVAFGTTSKSRGVSGGVVVGVPGPEASNLAVALVGLYFAARHRRRDRGKASKL